MMEKRGTVCPDVDHMKRLFAEAGFIDINAAETLIDIGDWSKGLSVTIWLISLDPKTCGC